MAKSYDNKARENIRVEFAKHYVKGISIVASSKLAGISPSTFYAWDKSDESLMKGGWLTKGGWSKKGW